MIIHKRALRIVESAIEEPIWVYHTSPPESQRSLTAGHVILAASGIARPEWVPLLEAKLDERQLMFGPEMRPLVLQCVADLLHYAALRLNVSPFEFGEEAADHVYETARAFEQLREQPEPD